VDVRRVPVEQDGEAFRLLPGLSDDRVIVEHVPLLSRTHRAPTGNPRERRNEFAARAPPGGQPPMVKLAVSSAAESPPAKTSIVVASITQSLVAAFQ